MTRDWETLHRPEEREVARLGGYGRQRGLGSRQATLVIDAVLGFTGRQGASHEAAIAEFRTACGPQAWEAVPRIAELLRRSRERGIPVLYTVPLHMKDDARGEFPPELAPTDGDRVVYKTKPSAFFRTDLEDLLRAAGIDHLLVAGGSTSGCVRASVYDAHARDLGATVIEDCVFDRFATSHRANLFDMNAKYADVRPLAEVLASL